MPNPGFALWCPKCGVEDPRIRWSLTMLALPVVHRSQQRGTVRVFRHRTCGSSTAFVVKQQAGVVA